LAVRGNENITFGFWQKMDGRQALSLIQVLSRAGARIFLLAVHSKLKAGVEVKFENEQLFP